MFILKLAKNQKIIKNPKRKLKKFIKNTKFNVFENFIVIKTY